MKVIKTRIKSIFVLMQPVSEKPGPSFLPDELDRRLAMSHLERYRLMMQLFRLGKMMEKAKVKQKAG